jgi:ABC-2 type transport system permease protein
MMQTFLNDIRLYRRLILIQIKAQMQYKANLLIDIATYFAVTALEFIGLLLYFVPFPSMLGWKAGEVALVAALMSLGFGMAELFGAGVDNFSEIIRRGEFDRLLLRPASLLVQLIGSDFRLRRLGRLTQGIVAFCIALYLLSGLHWTPLKMLLIPLSIMSGALFFIAILMLGATICFWTIETTELTSLLYYGGREMLSYPLTIYHQILQRFFLFVIPLAFGSFVPACYILEKPLPFGLSLNLAFIAPLLALIMAFICGTIWRFGVLHYQSTGS